MGLLGPRDVEVVRRVMEWTHTSAFAKRPLEILSGGRTSARAAGLGAGPGGGFRAAGRADRRAGFAPPGGRLRPAGPAGRGWAGHHRHHPRPERGRAVLPPASDRARGAHRRRRAARAGHAAGHAGEGLRRAADRGEKNPVTGAPMVVVLGRGASQAQEEATPWDC